MFSTFPHGSKPEFTQLFINGKFVNAQKGGVLRPINPTTEEVIGEFQAGTKEDIDLAVEAARTAFDKGPWGKSTPAERRRVLTRAADIIERDLEHIVAMESANNG